MTFIHLQVTTAYSLLSSTISIHRLVKYAKKLDYGALAITDRNVMYGVVPFYQECKRQGIKPIIGMTADILSEVEHGKSYPLLLLAKNEQGYKNLIKISSTIQAKNAAQGGISLQQLRAYGAGLFAISPGIEGEIEQCLLQNNDKKAKLVANLYKSIFRDHSFFLSIQRQGREHEEKLLPRLKQLASELQIKMVATNNVQYLEKDEAFAHECLLAIRDGVKLTDRKQANELRNECYFKTKEEMSALFNHDQEVLQATESIAHQCNVSLALHQKLLPKYPLQKGESAEETLMILCKRGLKERVNEPSRAYWDRLKYELNVIQEMGFSDYFLIVWDFMKFAREKGILTGPGRGSAAGSLVAYVLRITDVDPLKHQLLFERFLNPERISMPDIDIDFPDYRRDEVIAYVKEKYGEMHVAQIITFGTLGAKAVIRDVARAFGFSPQKINQLAKLIPSKPGITLESALQHSSKLRQFINGSSLHKQLYKTALLLEGLPRHTSTHAAGIVISDKPLIETIPIQAGHDYTFLTQYPMEILEEVGLLKMDFLGLRNLTILEQVLISIEKGQGKKIDIHSLPLNDKKTFELLRKGNTTGIFQLESEGMREVLRKLKPNEFEDIVAVNALYRPGPMENIPIYIARKHGKKQVQYPHPNLKDILEITYGVIVYQEQIMQIASKMAGFSLGEADLLRRAVSKKNKQILVKERAHFISGMMNRGYDKMTANKIYDYIVRFADYGFNRSHAVAYSMIAYQLAYLKAHYPLYFMAALLTSVIGNEEKIADYITKAKQSGIKILPPSINKSYFPFVVEKNAIRFSLAAIKGVGAVFLKELIQERRNGAFKDLFDVCIRLSSKMRKRRLLEALVFAGAFDEFNKDRATLLASLDVAIDHANLVSPEPTNDLFSNSEEFQIKPKYEETEPMPMIDKLANEMQVLGLYLSDHPIRPYEQLFKQKGVTPLVQITNEYHRVKVGVYITDTKTIRTKKGDAMSFIQLSDPTGEMDGVVFPNIHRRYSQLCQKDSVVLIEGKPEERNGKRQLIVEKVQDIESVKNEKTLYLNILEPLYKQDVLETIHTILHRYKGNTPVIIHYAKSKKTIRLNESHWVNPTNACIKEISELVGERNVVLQ